MWNLALSVRLSMGKKYVLRPEGTIVMISDFEQTPELHPTIYVVNVTVK